MARTRTSGIILLKDGTRIINKVYKGETIYRRLGIVSQEEAEQRLREEIAERAAIRRCETDDRHVFAGCAARYLIESQGKRTVKLLAYHVQLLLPFIGTLGIDHIHDGTLEEFKEARRMDGVSATTINRSLEVVRTILIRAARAWRDENGKPLLATAPPLITMETENPRPPHPLSWEEQDLLMPELPSHLQSMALFDINTGLRDENVCGLRWDWEVPIPEAGRSVFIIPESGYKTGVKHVAILNDAAWRIIEQQRAVRDAAIDAKDTDDIKRYVFTYDGHRIETMNNNGWQRARCRAAMTVYRKAGKQVPEHLLGNGGRGLIITDKLREFMNDAVPGFASVRVHDLRHTFSSRLRLAGVSQEDRNALMGHKSASIPEHYASADIGRLIELANKVLDRQGTRTLLRVVHG